MKNLIIYWVIGCFVIGFPMGRIITECPNAKIETDKLLGMVATWPLVFAMVFSRIGEPPLPKSTCEGLQ